MSEQPIERVFEYCPQCATKNPSVGEIPFRCQQCNYANFFGPVAAVGALVVDDQERLLLVRRARDPGKGRLGLPGGFVDRFETVEQALAREVMEETRLTITETTFLMTHPNRYNYRGVVAPVIDLFFQCRVAPGEITLADGELDDFTWVHPTEQHLSNLAFDSNRIALQHWLQVRSD